MTANLPAIQEPLTPPDCDLRCYEFMPLSVQRLRDSDLIEEVSAEGFRAAVLLWCKAWHEVPAASLPDNDKKLARYAGCGLAVDSWRAIREEALYGFVKCADGRLYHPVIAEKANEAWEARRKFMARSQAANDAKAARRAERENLQGGAHPDLQGARSPDLQGAKSGPKGSEVKGSEERMVRSNDLTFGDEAIPVDPITEGFELFWRTYPKRSAKDPALKAFRLALKSLKGSLSSRIKFLVDEAQRVADHFGDEKHFAVPPTTWLKDHRWTDELIPRPLNGGRAPAGRQGPTRADTRVANLLAGAVEIARRGGP